MAANKNIEDTYVVLDLSKVCRICFKTTQEMRSLDDDLKDEEIIAQDVNTLSEELLRVTSNKIVTDISLPTLMCQICIKLMHTAFRFKLMCNNSFNILQQYIDLWNKQIKVEKDTDNMDTLHTESTANGKNKKGVAKNVFEFYEVQGDEESNTHLCPICYKEFQVLEFHDHIQEHKGLKSYLNIPQKLKIGAKTRFFTTNINKQVYTEFETHMCVWCNEQIKTEEFRQHVLTHKNRTYKCDNCDRTFKKVNHLNTHKVMHLKDYPFNCDECGKGFVIEKNYECHKNTHTENLPYICSDCGARFSNPQHLSRHMTVHTDAISYDAKYKRIRCPKCLTTFKNKLEMHGHDCVPVSDKANKLLKPKNKGATQKRNLCTICGTKVFHIYKHIQIHHGQNLSIKDRTDIEKRRKYVSGLCTICGKNVGNIYSHMKNHETNYEKYPCNQCPKKFRTNQQLKRHLLVHSGLKPYICSICGKAFNNPHNLNVHERIHRGDRCHICPICEKGFLEKSYLRKHMNTHGKQV